MRGNDHEVIGSALRWAAAGHRSALLTVLTAFGASPRPAGAMAAIRDDGLIVGSVSGGCIEDDLASEIRDGLLDRADSAVILRVFGATASERDRYRLPCNNTIRIAIETNWNIEDLTLVMDALERDKVLSRRVEFASGKSSLYFESTSSALFAEDAESFTTSLGPHRRALVIGANEVGRYLAPILQTLDFRVSVCDPRSGYAESWQAQGIPVSRDMPDNWIVACKPDARTAVIAVAHDPKLDELALMEALRSRAFYVGAIGSIATTERRRARLLEFDVTAKQATRLRGPVGLNIGSRTPAEIAVSIAAELIQAIRGGGHGADAGVLTPFGQSNARAIRKRCAGG